MCRIASLFLLQRLKGSMSGDARDFNNIETQAVIKFFFLQGKALKEIHAILTVTYVYITACFSITRYSKITNVPSSLTVNFYIPF